MTPMNKEQKNLLVFGYGLVVISLFLSWRIYVKHGWTFLIWFLVGASLISLWMTLFRQDLLKAFYKRWMKVAHIIGGIMTAVILSVIFYGVFGVVGIILRILRKDLLHLGLDRSAKSYWTARAETPFDKAHCTRQF